MARIERVIWGYRVSWKLWKLASWLRYKLTGNCGNACDYVEFTDYKTGKPFVEFVPEAECPIHDKYQMSSNDSDSNG